MKTKENVGAKESKDSSKIAEPKKSTAQGACTDKKCAIHGPLKIRGKLFEGVVISDRMQRAVTVEWQRIFYLPKYERYERRRSKVKARKPDCLIVKKGDKVKIAECRPLSKTISFIVIEVLK